MDGIRRFDGRDEMLAPQEEMTEREPVIDREMVKRGIEILEEYRRGKQTLDARIRENEEWYRLRHWGQTGRSRNLRDPEPTSAWLLNCLMNKHADAMDNYPEPSVLPRERADKAGAEALSEILPAILERCEYEKVYSEMWWKKLKAGAGCVSVVWDPRAYNGLGEVAIEAVDILNVFWEPGVSDIQDGENFFRVEAADNSALEREYPMLKGKLGGEDISTVKYYFDDMIDTSKKTPVVDWYYRTRTQSGKTVTQMIRFAAGEVLFASENVPEMAETGFYAHGKYPFVMDIMFPVAGSPAGFGFLDICKDPQMFIDKMNQVMLKAAALSKPRFIIRADGILNEEEYADVARDFIHYQGSGNPRDNIMQVDVPDMPAYVMNMLQFKVDELKETSGNTDFGQGVTASGVTAGSAIAALQEAGGKLSRDMMKTSYRAYTQECYLVIELIRQFYDVTREFRILGEDGVEKFVDFSNAGIKSVPQGSEFGVNFGEREPVFDVKVRPSKANAFSRLSQNELAKEFYQAGFFNPQMADQALACIEMMDFEGKDEVERRIAQNGTLFEQVQMMQQQMAQMAAMLDQATGSNLTAQMAAGGQSAGGAPMPSGSMPQERRTALDAVRDRVDDIGNPQR